MRLWAEAPNVGTPGRKIKSRKVGAAAKTYDKLDVADREELKHPGGGKGVNRENAVPVAPKNQPKR
jgi:hypothetical protein